MREMSCDNLIDQYKHKQPEHHGVAEGEDHIEREVNENLNKVVWTGHILKQSPSWDVMSGVLNIACRDRRLLV
ncbi:hypothetical protein DPMN_108051 [Dreissena polymorpha]|uniref:Uncharacterized protein n=1 Tax=Dreissena polymorpha TaxID=45954 RepID=A0A9D4K8C4_DREPO|nr:hypothetical protein DPMN_108051 [Dreissena polymorpha]